MNTCYRSHFDVRQPCRRWTPKRKAELVEAIQRRWIGLDEALAIHGIGPEEMQAWAVALRKSPAALRVTRLGEGAQS